MTRRDSRGGRPAHDDSDPDRFFGEARSRQSRRKDFQLCGQVQRALSVALAADFQDEVLNELSVVRVEPAPTASRLMVWVAGPPGSSPALIMERLGQVMARLRAEVADAIHRKQVPTLCFALCDP